jgi:hypothetical protein
MAGGEGGTLRRFLPIRPYFREKLRSRRGYGILCGLQRRLLFAARQSTSTEIAAIVEARNIPTVQRAAWLSLAGVEPAVSIVQPHDVGHTPLMHQHDALESSSGPILTGRAADATATVGSPLRPKLDDSSAKSGSARVPKPAAMARRRRKGRHRFILHAQMLRASIFGGGCQRPSLEPRPRGGASPTVPRDLAGAPHGAPVQTGRREFATLRHGPPRPLGVACRSG